MKPLLKTANLPRYCVAFRLFFKNGRHGHMKLITVILRPEKVFELKNALTSLGCHGITTKDCSGLGENKKTIKQVFLGEKYENRDDAVKRVEMKFVVNDEIVEKITETIRNASSTSQGGDGRIYISTLDDAIHIHSGDRHTGDTKEPWIEDV